MSSPEAAAVETGPAAFREITFAEAVKEALCEEMERDPTVFVVGEDVAEAGTPFKVLSGLVEQFGVDRVMDSPISEAGITGLGVGAAMTGLRPIVDIMFGDFLGLTLDQLANQAAKTQYTRVEWKVPMVLRTTLGTTRRPAATQPIAACMGQSRARPESRASGNAVRREGTAQSSITRRQLGGLLRG